MGQDGPDVLGRNRPDGGRVPRRRRGLGQSRKHAVHRGAQDGKRGSSRTIAFGRRATGIRDARASTVVRRVPDRLDVPGAGHVARQVQQKRAKGGNRHRRVAGVHTVIQPDKDE